MDSNISAHCNEENLCVNIDEIGNINVKDTENIAIKKVRYLYFICYACLFIWITSNINFSCTNQNYWIKQIVLRNQLRN